MTCVNLPSYVHQIVRARAPAVIGHLVSGTDAAGMVLFDPLAVRTALGGRGEIGQEEVDAAAAAGALLYWYTAADGTHSMRVYVDEPAPADVVAKARNRASGRLLRVPGGRVVFAGAEILLDVNTRPDRWPGREPALAIAPGDYLVDAFELAASAEDDAAFDAAVRDIAGSWATRAADLLVLVTGSVVMLTASIVIPAIAMLFVHPARLLAVLPAALLWLGLPWALVLVAWQLPAITRVQAAREQLDSGWPDAVAVLRRVADGEPRPAGGGGFGVGYADV